MVGELASRAGEERSEQSAFAGAAVSSTGSRSQRAKSLQLQFPITGLPPIRPRRRRSRQRCEFHNAGLDDRVNTTSFPWITALRSAGKTVKFFLYEGVNHAFNNDTSAERYNKAAADQAWMRTLAFFKQHLG